MSPAPKDVCGRAMDALEAELVLPRELEEQMLDAVADVRAASEPVDVPAAGPGVRSAVGQDPMSTTPQRRATRFAVAAALVAVAAGVALGVSAWLAERRASVEASAASPDAIDAAERAARAVAAIDWADATPWREKMAVLEALRIRVEGLGDPAALARIAPRYGDGVRRAFLDAGKVSLENALRAGTGAWSLEERANLKAYLLLADPIRLASDLDWEAARLTATCSETIAAAGRVPVDAISPLVASHVATYLRLLERGAVRGPELDVRLVERTRGVLSHAEPRRYFDVFVTPLVDEPRDPQRPAGRDDLAYPPITLDAVLGDHDAPSPVQSRSKKSWGAPYEVLGVYTGGARRAVFRSLEAALDGLARDAWVVGDASADRRTREALEQVRDDYDGLYVHEWESFLGDVEVSRPSQPREAARVLRVIAAVDSPLVGLLRAIAENTRPVAARVGLGAGDPVALRFEAIARFVADDAALARYRALVAAAADDLEAGRRAEATRLADEVRALLPHGEEGGRERLAALLLAPLVAPR